MFISLAHLTKVSVVVNTVEPESIKDNDNDILNGLSIVRNVTSILNYFIQFTCTNLDGSQREGTNF